MGSVTAFLRKPSNQRLLSWLGGGAVILAGGIWTVVTYVWPPHSPEGGGNKGVVIAAAVTHSTITNTINEENPATLKMLVDSSRQQGQLATKLKVTVDAVEGMLRAVGEENAPPEEIPVRLGQLAAQYAVLRQQLGQLSDADPASAALKRQAAAYLAAGQYDRAEKLWSGAHEQIHAVELLSAGQPDQALAALNRSQQYLGDPAIRDTVGAQLQQAYNYKTQAEIFSATGDKVREQQSLTAARALFKRVRDADPGITTIAEFAGAINGAGNIDQLQGDYRRAITEYGEATTILPSYAYAWHDMLSAYIALANAGEIDLGAMQRALAKVQETGRGLPGLDGNYLAGLAGTVARFGQNRPP